MFALVESINISDMTTALDEDDGYTAFVSCTHIELTKFVDGETILDSYSNIFALAKEGGKWLICEIINTTEMI